MKSPNLDIIVPAISDAEELGKCLNALDSWLNPLVTRHWIIVDDCGDKDVTEEAEFFAVSRAMVTVIRNEKRLYYSRSVNRALDFVRSKQVIVCSPGVQVEDKGTIDKLLQPFHSDPKAILSVADCRCDWNSSQPSRIDRAWLKENDPKTDMWAINKAGLQILGKLDECRNDDEAFTFYVERAVALARAWLVRSVRTTTVPTLAPARMPSISELDRRCRVKPTVLVDR
jgi:GT2 family glycosyltransferase